MSGMLAIINASEEDYNKLAEAIDNSTGAADRRAKQMQDNLKGRLTELKSAIEGVALQRYEHMKPALESIVAAIKQAVDWFAKLPPGAQQVIVIIAALAAAIGPLLLVLGMFAASLGSIMSFIGTFGPAIAGIAGPVGIATAAITALAGAAFLIVKNWGHISEFFAGLWDSVVSVTSAAWETIKTGITNVWEAIKSGVTSTFESIVDFLMGIWNGVTETWNS